MVVYTTGANLKVMRKVESTLEVLKDSFMQKKLDKSRKFLDSSTTVTSKFLTRNILFSLKIVVSNNIHFEEIFLKYSTKTKKENDVGMGFLVRSFDTNNFVRPIKSLYKRKLAEDPGKFLEVIRKEQRVHHKSLVLAGMGEFDETGARKTPGILDTQTH